MDSKKDIEDWDTQAHSYNERIANGGGRFFPQMAERFWGLLGDIDGKSVLDLGCGQGWLSGELSSRGASVVGIDGSEKLLRFARTNHPDYSFLASDLQDGLPPLEGHFDAVVSNMVVMDIPEIGKLFRSVGEVLRHDGTFVFTLPHPCFFMHKSEQDEAGNWYRKVTDYLTISTKRIDSFGGHNHYHRPLSYYISHLREAGLFVFDLFEPGHQSKSNRVDPDFSKRFPIFTMIAAAKK